MSVASRLQAAWLHRGWLATLLLPASWIYQALVALRAAFFETGWIATERLPVPVVVVGNLVAGGAGKTPTVIAVVKLLRDRGYNPGIVSRGYGREAGDVILIGPDASAKDAGDEPMLMSLRTHAPVAVGSDRVAAARALLASHAAIDIVVSDDGLQHKRLARDVQVIVFDERGAGNGWLLPAGPLREPMPPRCPDRSIILYNAPAPSTSLTGHLASRHLLGLVDLASWWAGRPPLARNLSALQGHDVMAAAGLARPQRFYDMLRAHGLVVSELPLPDHYPFDTLPWPAATSHVIVTEKDAVKLRPEAVGATQVWVAPLDFELGPQFAADLFQWLPRPNPSERQ